MKAFAVKSNAKVNSRPTCGAGSENVSGSEAQRKSAQGAFSAKVSCCESRSMKMLSMKAQRPGVWLREALSGRI